MADETDKKVTLYWIWYIVAVLFFGIALSLLFRGNNFLADGGAHFMSGADVMEKRFVADDAQNYIIAGNYAIIITLRSLIFAVLGCASMILAKLSK